MVFMPKSPKVPQGGNAFGFGPENMDERSGGAFGQLKQTPVYDDALSAPPNPGKTKLVGSPVNVGLPDVIKPAHVPRSTFEAGMRGSPKSGRTVHELMSDGDLVARAKVAIAHWQQQNPKKKIKGPSFRQILKEELQLSDAQARRFLRRLMPG